MTTQLLINISAKLVAIELRGESKTAANKKLSEILKKGGLVVNQTVVHLMKCVQAKKNATEESGRNLYLFVAFFLTNSIASNPPFLKLRQALMRYAQC
jgi:hypothetical protein